MIPAPAWYVWNPIPVQHWYKPFFGAKNEVKLSHYEKNESKGHTFRCWGYEGHQEWCGILKKIIALPN
jgi:hypothetical protein